MQIVKHLIIIIMGKRKTTAITPQQAEAIKNLPERLDIRVDWAFKHFFGKKKQLLRRSRRLPGQCCRMAWIPPLLPSIPAFRSKRWRRRAGSDKHLIWGLSGGGLHVCLLLFSQLDPSHFPFWRPKLFVPHCSCGGLGMFSVFGEAL